MIKIGIIGCGKITEARHAPEYSENPNCKLAAWYNRNPARAQTMADTYGGVVCNTVQELLAQDIDAVSVCVANRFHAEMSIMALESGKHVLCEKPMAVTAEECDAMLAAEKKSGKMLMISQNQRMALAHRKARQLYHNGEIGRLLSFRMIYGHPGPEAWVGNNQTWFFDKKTASFGAMADLGVHKTDLLHYLTGEKIVETTAVTQTIDKKNPDGTPVSVDDNAYCIYRLSGGATGTMHVSWTFYGNEENSTVLYGSEGRLRIYDDAKYSLILEKPNGQNVYYVLDELTSNKDAAGGDGANSGVIDAFIESIETGVKKLASGEDGAAAMHVIFSNERSAAQHKTIEVSNNK